VHPDIVRLVSQVADAGISCAIITNGWFLPRYIRSLASAGLSRLIVSIDSADLAEHECNRGLDGLEQRLAEGIAQARACGLPVQASVTVSRLVRYDELPDTLRRLGFDCVSFSYPRREPLGSTSLVYGASDLVDLDRDELLAALTAIRRLKGRFPVLNPRASLAEVARYIRGERQAVPCIGGYKYFYLDWNLDIWRCEAWNEPQGSVFDLDRIPDQRTLQFLHDGLLPQCQRADARRRRRHGCRAGARGRSSRSCGGVAVPAQRGAVVLGTDRGESEDAPLGSPAEASCGRRSPPRSLALERGDRSMTRRRLHLLRAALFVAALTVTAAPAEPAIAQSANSNAGFEGGQDGLFDAILRTPNRKTPVPQDNIFATAPGAERGAPTPQSKAKAIGTPPVMNRISPEEHH
jgi:MoaA/NifB/PqqE/SkfB family radical SAM enzyme